MTENAPSPESPPPEERANGESPEAWARRVLGQRVRAHRRAMGLTIEQFAHAAGLERTYISAVERGRYGIGLKNLGYISFTLGIDPADLVRGLALDPFSDDER